jgi:hypothetical protein
VFEYGDERVVEKIRTYTGNALDIAFDTISEGKTPKQVTGAIGDKGEEWPLFFRTRVLALM